MALPPITTEPMRQSYDVVIVGGGMIGSSVAAFLAQGGFDGSVLVVEMDPSYAFASTSHTNSCIRQQFSSEINVRISQFGAAYIKGFREIWDDPRVPEIRLQAFGYLYLADTPEFATILEENQAFQAGLGAGTRILTRDEIAAAYPFYALDDVLLGSHNPVDEGYFDGAGIFDWWRRLARERGVEYVTNRVAAVTRDGTRVRSVTLSDGHEVACGTLVNASGPRAAATARMAGLDLPVEPRKRYTFVFDAAEPLGQDLPLTIDPSGVHVRSEGAGYLAGCPPDDDPAVAPDDFEEDHTIWEEKVWPALAARIPAFEAIRLRTSWVGHYAYNTLDQNAILGPHPEVANFLFANGFSGHGLQQSPAVGRGIAEWIMHASYRSLDLSPLGVDRVLANRPLLERAVI